MSFSAALVCEDHTLDQYVVRPVVDKLLAAVGRPRARLKVVNNPRLQGIDDVFREANPILLRYGAVADAVIFMVDADLKDGQDGRTDRAESLRNVLAKCERHKEKAYVVTARQEVEVWALWGSRGELADSWGVVRLERDPKEKYFDPLLTQNDLRTPGKGRARLIEKTLQGGWQSLRTGCPELGDLEREIVAGLRASS